MFAPEPGGGAAFAGISTSVNNILAAANSGGFTVTPEAGTALINAIDDLHTAVNDALMKSRTLEQEPPLGETPAAKVYKPFLATVASDPAQGAIPVFKKLQTDLVNAKAAVNQAMKNYDEHEQSQKAVWA